MRYEYVHLLLHKRHFIWCPKSRVEEFLKSFTSSFLRARVPELYNEDSKYTEFTKHDYCS